MNVLRGSLTAGAFAAAIGCTVPINWPQHDVKIALRSDAGSLRTVSSAGFEIDVSDLRLGIESVELERCSGAAERRSLPGFADLLLPSADAHGVSTSTKNGVPHVVRPLNAGTVKLAALTPPTDSYCHVVVEVGPADNDAVGLDDRAMVGSSIQAEGRFREVDDEAWHQFRWATSSRATITLPLREPLELGDTSQQESVELVTEALAWFEDADCEQGSDESATRLLENLVSNMRIDGAPQ